MSEGMLSWQTLNCPFNRTGRKVKKGSNTSYTLVPLSQLAFPTQYRGFVSGPSYARRLDEGAVPTAPSMTEAFSNFWSGDTGHEYYKRQIKHWNTDNSLWNVLVAGNANYSPLIADTWNDNIYRPQWSPTLQWWMSDSVLAKEGVGFLKGTMPTKPEADLLRAVIEVLREGLPSYLFAALVKPGYPGKRQTIRNLSGDFLNYMFGISPLVQEVAKTFMVISRVNDIVEQWQRDNGKDTVRRRQTNKEFFSSSRPFSRSPYSFTGAQSWTVPLGPSKGNAQNGWAVGSSSVKRWTVEDTVTRTQRFGFSAAYNYNLRELINSDLPFGLSDMSNEQQSIYIVASALGLNPAQVNASMLWELIPFSWLVDWFVNIGDVLSVATTLNKSGLQVLFAYLTVVEELEWSQKWAIESTDPRWNGRGTNEVRAFSMRRIRATPYGFGGSFESLSPFQGSILAALAGSKLPSK